MKFNILAASAFLALSLPSLYADDCCPSGASSAPCTTGCDCDKPCATLRTARSCVCTLCPPIQWGFTTDLSFLYWQAREDGLEFAAKNSPKANPNLAANVDARMVGFDFTWEPAFKLNLALQFPNAWEFAARWTCLYSHSSYEKNTTIDRNTTKGFLPIWILPQSYHTTPTLYGQTRASWQLHFNTLDLELGADTLLTPKLSLRLHGGIKGISILQQFIVNYSQGVTDGVISLLPSKAIMSNACYGLGPRIGVNALWRFCTGWNLLSSFAGSLTLNHFKIKRNDSDNAIDVSGSQVYTEHLKFQERAYCFRPNLEAMLGLGWMTCYGCRNQYEFGLNAAYEVQYYWEQNLMCQLIDNQISFQAFSPRGDLSCQGLTATLRFGF